MGLCRAALQYPANLFAGQTADFAASLGSSRNVRDTFHLSQPLGQPVGRMAREGLERRRPAVGRSRRVSPFLDETEREPLDIVLAAVFECPLSKRWFWKLSRRSSFVSMSSPLVLRALLTIGRW